MPISVFVIDDHPVVREGLRMLVASRRELTLLGVAGSVAAALPAISAAPPDVLLLDLDLGTEDGLGLLPSLAAAAPGTRVLVLTGVRDRARHEQVLLAGARGLVGKEAPPDVLLKAIEKVHGGELWFDRSLLTTAVQHTLERDRTPAAEDKLADLTSREREIVPLVAQGLRNDDIARRLGVTPKTVRNHLSSIYDKLGVSDRVELLVFAYENGLVKRG